MTVSLCMIVRDEESALPRCLQSVSGVFDEIIIADTGSTDGTKEIAKSFGARVYDFAWIDDFSAARNFALSKATSDYLFWLDADDVVEPEQREKLLALKAQGTQADVVMMRYSVPPLVFPRERMFKNRAGFFFCEPVHEAVTPRGRVVYSDITITHKKEKPREPGRNLRIYEKALAKGLPLSPRGAYYYARELAEAGRRGEAAAGLEEFLAEGRGWVEDNVGACLLLSDCLDDADKKAEAVYRGFAYASPRPEGCCRLGQMCMESNKLYSAVFWFKMAMESEGSSAGFFDRRCAGLFPARGLSECYEKLGDKANAERFSRLAASLAREGQAAGV